MSSYWAVGIRSTGVSPVNGAVGSRQWAVGIRSTGVSPVNGAVGNRQWAFVARASRPCEGSGQSVARASRPCEGSGQSAVGRLCLSHLYRRRRFRLFG